MSGGRPRRAQAAKRSYAESDGEDAPAASVQAPVTKAPAKRKPANKKTKKSADIVEDDDKPADEETAAEPAAEDAQATDDAAAEAEPAKEEAAAVAETAPAAAEDAPAPSSETVTVGGKVPSDIKLKDHEGNDVEVGSLSGEKGYVLFLVPKANTPGCTNQACLFRDNHKDFTDLGFEVYSLSQDTEKALSSWKQNKELPYKLLSDPQQQLIARLGASKSAKTVNRSHFIIGKDGDLLLSTVGVKPAESYKLCLEFIKAL